MALLQTKTKKGKYYFEFDSTFIERIDAILKRVEAAGDLHLPINEETQKRLSKYLDSVENELDKQEKKPAQPSSS